MKYPFPPVFPPKSFNYIEKEGFDLCYKILYSDEDSYFRRGGKKMFKRTEEEESDSGVEVELYELSVPGKLIGKEVVDSRARRVGIVRSVRMNVPSLKAEIIVKGTEIEFPIDVENISAIGNLVQLQNIVREAEEIEIRDVVRLQNELWEEIRSYLER